MSYALIKPLTKLKKGLNLLDYRIPEGLSKNIKIGQLVEIPFRNSIQFGLVFDLMEKTEYRENLVKSILSIKNETPIISKNQINFYKWFCDNNFSSLNFLNNIIPIPLKNKLKEKNEEFFIKKRVTKLRKINTSIFENKVFIFKHNYFEEKISLIKNIIDKNTKENKLTLIICPTKIHIEKTLSSLLNFYTQNDFKIITGNTHLSKTKHNDIWNALKNKNIKFIIGTKMSIFYDATNIASIIIDESENENLNQVDVNPRFEFLPNAFELSKINNCQLIFTSYTPSAYLYSLAKQKEVKLFETKEKINTEISLLDMSVKFFENNIHFNCETEISKTLSENKKVLFLLNKKGYSKNLKCKDCGFVFQCENCNSTLSIKKENGIEKLHCYNCEKQIDIPFKCPKCSSVRLDDHGVGTEQFYQTISKKWSDKNVSLIDKDNYENLKLIGLNDVVIATRLIIDYLKENEFDLIIFPFSYQFLNTSFDSNEDFFKLISKLISLSPKKIMIQTQNELKIYYHIYNQDYKAMIEEELENRKLFHYPPYGNIIKITLKDTDKSYLDKKTIELYDKIRIQKKDLSPTIIEPNINKLRSFFIKHILIKYNNYSEIEKLKDILDDVDIIEKNSSKF